MARENQHHNFSPSQQHRRLLCHAGSGLSRQSPSGITHSGYGAPDSGYNGPTDMGRFPHLTILLKYVARVKTQQGYTNNVHRCTLVVLYCSCLNSAFEPPP